MSKRPNNKQNLPKKQERQDISNMYIVYTDGSADNQRLPNYGGSAFVILDPANEEILHQYSQGFAHTSNNKMELHAIIEAMKTLPNNSRCSIFTDSKYCIHVLDHKTCDFSKNMEYIQEFRDTIEDKNIKYQFNWVKGHNGAKWNEFVDKLANEAFEKMGGQVIDYKRFKTDLKYRCQELNKSKYINACAEIAKDYIPVHQFDSFIKELNLKFSSL